MSSAEFNLGEVVEVVLNQVTILSNERDVQITYDAPAGVASMYLYGDNIRLQQVLSDFLANVILFTPAFEGSAVLLRLNSRKKRIGSRVQIVHLEFRYVPSYNFCFCLWYMMKFDWSCVRCGKNVA